MKKNIVLWVFACATSVASAQSDMYRLFGCRNIIAPTIITTETEKIAIDIAVQPSTDLSKIQIITDLFSDNTIEGGQMTAPSDFSVDRTQTFSLSKPAGSTNVVMNVRQLLASELPLSLTFNSLKTPASWTNETKGWLAQGCSTNTQGELVLDKKNASIIFAFTDEAKNITWDIIRTGTDFNGIFSVETSATGNDFEWKVQTVRPTPTSIIAASEHQELPLTADVRFVRFTLDAPDANGAAIKLNNFLITSKSSSVESQTLDFKFYPNPVSDILRIEAESEVEYKVFNLLGVIELSGKGNAINVSELAAGNYYLQATVGEKTSTCKFIKQ